MVMMDKTWEIGATCRYTNDCKSGCCLYNRKTEKRTCQKMAIKGERCTSGQIKLNSYVDFCPCAKGNKFCEYPDNVCKE
ncbi:U-scoloptoxin(18)-Er1a-like isoform X2 [Tachypleus tridentatus]|uniref:U-scoloptoxin(18)-Er1a-like isoform X2 n=1 Tax=Tachypleus tridentatus TaxID=6853 RepID=UPI003FCFA222